MTNEFIGYGRPPKDKRFRPGESGNPAGRPKGSRNFVTELREELATLLPGQKSVTKQRAIVNKLVAEAIGGDARALAILVSFALRKDSDDRNDELAPEDREVIARFRNGRAKTATTELSEGGAP